MRDSKRIYTLILLLLPALSSTIIHPIYPFHDEVEVSPGEFDFKLGEGYPKEDRVKLEYPKTTILANSMGELLFNITLTTFNYTSQSREDSIIKTISLYIPPEFTVNNDVASVWTSFTNNYNPSSIFLTRAFTNDPIGPNWNIIRIFNLNITKSGGDVENRIFLENCSQIVRLFNVTAPSIAGRYFFKVFITIDGLTYSIGSPNFPTIVVKAALNPAYVSGVVRYGDTLIPELYGRPLDYRFDTLPQGYGGRVYAEGLTSDGRKVSAQAYFNASGEGRYTLYGLAPATYNFTVHAAGYLPQRFLEVVTVARGQSIENLDLYLREGMNITGVIRSKHGFEEIPWGPTYSLLPPPFNVNDKVIRVEVTDLDENVIASSPLHLFDRNLLVFRPRDTLDPSSTSYTFSLKREVGWDGHIPQDYANYTSGIPSGDYYVKAHVTSYVQLDPAVVHVRNETRVVETAFDLQRTNYFNITVHFKERAWLKTATPTLVGGYLYYEVVDAAGAVVGFNVSYVPEGVSTFTMQVRGIDIWNRLFSSQIAWLFTHDRGLLPGRYTINAIFLNQTGDFVALNALITSSPELRRVFPTATGPLVTAFPPTTLELTNRETPLYFQLDQVKGGIGGFCNRATELSFDLVLGGGFNITVYPIDWQKPPIIREWAHPGSDLRIDILKYDGTLIDTLRTNLTQPPGKFLTISSQGVIRSEAGVGFGRAIGLKEGSYILKIYTPGYLEDPSYSPILIPVTLGDITDTRVNLIRGAVIDLTVTFKTEGIFDPIDNRLGYARPLNNIDAFPVRVELFDAEGEMVAANLTYVKVTQNSLHISLEGFNDYWGNPRLLWTNFYDTTDAERLVDSGLEGGDYQVRVTVAGYYQPETITLHIDRRGEWWPSPISLTVSVERLGYLWGYIVWADWLDQGLPLSWAAITAYRGNGFDEAYTFSVDGFYEMWLIPGEYDFGLAHPGFETKYLKYGLHVGPGSQSSITFFMN